MAVSVPMIEGIIGLAAQPGFEPGQKDPKSFVLPLHNWATFSVMENELNCNTTYGCGQWGYRLRGDPAGRRYDVMRTKGR